MNRDALLALAINRLTVLKSNEKLLLSDVVDTTAFYRSLDHQSLGRVIGRPLREGTVLPMETLRAAERDMKFCSDRRVLVVTFWDETYPPALREIFDPPFLLFVRGRLPDPGLPNIAVVGTREPTAAAVAAAERLAEGICTAGHAVISGLARGIDAAAHRGALRAGAGQAGTVHSGSVPTGAVLGCGIDSVCPASNRALASRILTSGGFLMSEYSPGVGSAKYHFPARNRIISGLSRAVVVVQAPARSGALITADYALDQGRDLFVHAAGLVGEVGIGSLELAEDGAKILKDAGGIFEEWGVAISAPSVPDSLRSEGRQTGLAAGRCLAEDMRRVLVSGGADE